MKAPKTFRPGRLVRIARTDPSIPGAARGRIGRVLPGAGPISGFPLVRVHFSNRPSEWHAYFYPPSYLRPVTFTDIPRPGSRVTVYFPGMPSRAGRVVVNPGAPSTNSVPVVTDCDRRLDWYPLDRLKPIRQ